MTVCDVCGVPLDDEGKHGLGDVGHAIVRTPVAASDLQRAGRRKQPRAVRAVPVHGYPPSGFYVPPGGLPDELGQHVTYLHLDVCEACIAPLLAKADARRAALAALANGASS